MVPGWRVFHHHIAPHHVLFHATQHVVPEAMLRKVTPPQSLLYLDKRV